MRVQFVIKKFVQIVLIYTMRNFIEKQGMDIMVFIIQEWMMYQNISEENIDPQT